MDLIDKITIGVIAVAAILIAVYSPRPHLSPIHMYLLGVAHYREGNTPTAIEYWKICSELPARAAGDKEMSADCRKALAAVRNVPLETDTMKRWRARRSGELPDIR